MENAAVFSDRRSVRTLFFLCWLVYACAYVSRQSYSAVLPQLLAEGFMDKAAAGLISTLFFFSYAAGQLVNGLLSDKLDPARMALAGIVGAGLANVFMGFAADYRPMLLLWAVNGYCLSMLWPPMLRLFSTQLTAEDGVKCAVHMSTAIVAGTLFACVASAAHLRLWGWRPAFWCAGGQLIGMAGLWLFGIRVLKGRMARFGVPMPKERKAQTKAPVRSLFTAAVLLLALPVMIQGMLRDGVSSWVPSYISENFWTDPSFAILLSALLPVVNLAGPYAARFLYQRVFRREAACAAVLFAVAAAALICLVSFGQTGAVACVAFFALVTMTMEGVNTVVVSILPLRYGAVGRAATVSGLFNFFTYTGTAASTYGVGLLVEKNGWQSAFVCWIMAALAAVLVCLLAARAPVRVNGEEKARQ